jgi:hypothetical protein
MQISNHPLLIRSVFDDEKVGKMAEIASAHGLYGGNCSYERVHKELLGYSDHQLHQFASEWRGGGTLCVEGVATL